MTDSPASRVPLDPEEQPILDNLLGVRDKLLLLKSDKSNYVKSQDVVSHYDRIIDQVHALNKVRTHKRDEQNRRTYKSQGHMKPWSCIWMCWSCVC